MEISGFVILLLTFTTGLFLILWLKTHFQQQKEHDALIQAEEQLKAIEREMQDRTEQLPMQFENIANKILENSAQKLSTTSHQKLSELLNPLQEKIKDFQKKIDDNFNEEAKERRSLQHQIRNIIETNEKMTLEANSLTKALRGDSKQQGSWGEHVLESILETSGLRKDEEYILQGKGMQLTNISGDRIAPDVVIKLPENKHIIIDSKVSLTYYDQFVNEEEEDAKARHLKAFTTSVRARVKELAEKQYHTAEKLGTPDFTLMFMPIEGAYILALQEDKNLHDYAWEQRVIIVGPSTLMITLQTVASIWRLERQNKNTQEIARQGGALYDKMVGFVEDMQQICKRIDALDKAYDGAMNKLRDGRGSIISRTENLKQLGAKASKSMPEEALVPQEEPKELELVS